MILLILSHTLTPKFALKLLRRGKRGQTEKGHTFHRESEGLGAAVRCGSRVPPSRPDQNMKRFYIAEYKFPNSQNLSLKKVKP